MFLLQVVNTPRATTEIREPKTPKEKAISDAIYYHTPNQNSKSIPPGQSLLRSPLSGPSKYSHLNKSQSPQIVTLDDTSNDKNDSKIITNIPQSDVKSPLVSLQQSPSLNGAPSKEIEVLSSPKSGLYPIICK